MTDKKGPGAPAREPRPQQAQQYAVDIVGVCSDKCFSLRDAVQARLWLCGDLTTGEIANEFNISFEEARQVLQELEAEGRISGITRRHFVARLRPKFVCYEGMPLNWRRDP